MDEPTRTVRRAVKGAYAETYLLTSLVCFAGSVILTRLFLELTGYPQLGNQVLHVAHALWGGLLLVAAVLVPLTLANRWAFTLSAVLSGLGIGLFIDEVGKFITQKNDYFYPPAAPLIYSFFLLLVLLYLFVQRRQQAEPRSELYRALFELYELVDNNLDPHELHRLLARLETARQSDMPHVAGLAASLQNYLHETPIPLVPARPVLSRRIMAWLKHYGERLGRPRHRILIVLGMAAVSVGMLTAIVLVLYAVFSPNISLRGALKQLADIEENQVVLNELWFYLRLGMEFLVGILALFSVYCFSRRNESRAVQAALLALLLSLTGVVTLSFYLYQFATVTSALFQFALLLLVLAYRRWYASN